ncbi:putative protein MSS51-like protein [Lachnellula suecica]|uniref:MYND-type domain-containing protein n=1 Tax=Lachnellula suecica TaxID=602035 RepID=A0A8T9BX03_9HELO|nr:putative protein MSS51-like protein [Lachnellula suecica]
MAQQRPAYGDVSSNLPTPILAIRHAICVSCHNPIDKPKKCGGCKRASYCSPECQKKDWKKSHQKLCKILIASNERRVETSRIGRSWEQYRSEKRADIDAFRQQNPGYSENDQRFLMYEPSCRHCFRSAPQLEAKNALKPCYTCEIVSFCQGCPQTHPTSECETFENIRIDEIFAIEHHRDTGKELPIIWYDYYTKISDKDIISSSLTPEMQPIPKPAKEDGRAVELAAMLRSASVTLSMALTIVAALEALDLTGKQTIKLHFVGAAAREMVRLMVFEEILHLIPSLKHLQLTFVGFDIPKRAAGEPEGPVKLDCCPSCTSQGRTRSLNLWKGAYHDYVKTLGYEKPDLAVAFHSGFSQESQMDWLPTIQYLTVAPHPTVFTSYNENEMAEETAILGGLGAKFFLSGELNKWRGLCPVLEVMEEKENSVYYLHQYWYILAGGGK